jgi:hypothetical protein
MTTRSAGRGVRFAATRGVVAAVMAGALAGCAGRVTVSTVAAPDASFAGQRTFRFLPVPQSRATQPDAPSADNPMLENSISGREVRHDITQVLASRGYVHQRQTADLAIAYYIGSHTALEVTNYDYGYPFSDPKMAPTVGGQLPPPAMEHTYQEGTVIIDVLDSDAKHILWRGVGRCDVPADSHQYAHALATVVAAVMQKFPGRAAPASAAMGR